MFKEHKPCQTFNKVFLPHFLIGADKEPLKIQGNDAKELFVLFNCLSVFHWVNKKIKKKKGFSCVWYSVKTPIKIYWKNTREKCSCFFYAPSSGVLSNWRTSSNGLPVVRNCTQSSVISPKAPIYLSRLDRHFCQINPFARKEKKNRSRTGKIFEISLWLKSTNKYSALNIKMFRCKSGISHS